MISHRKPSLNRSEALASLITLPSHAGRIASRGRASVSVGSTGGLVIAGQPQAGYFSTCYRSVKRVLRCHALSAIGELSALWIPGRTLLAVGWLYQMSSVENFLTKTFSETWLVSAPCLKTDCTPLYMLVLESCCDRLSRGEISAG